VKDFASLTDGTNRTFTISVPKTWNGSVKYTYTSAGA